MRGPLRFLAVVLLISTAAARLAAAPPPAGLRAGDSVEPWNPVHVAGPDRGTTLCPVCTYLERPAVVAFVKDGGDIVDLTARIEGARGRQPSEGPQGLRGRDRRRGGAGQKIAAAARVERAALCVFKPESREKELRAYRVRPESAVTIVVYQNYTVVACFVDLPPKDFGRVEAVVARLRK